jgi:hypothetical protein
MVVHTCNVSSSEGVGRELQPETALSKKYKTIFEK